MIGSPVSPTEQRLLSAGCFRRPRKQIQVVVRLEKILFVSFFQYFCTEVLKNEVKCGEHSS